VRLGAIGCDTVADVEWWGIGVLECWSIGVGGVGGVGSGWVEGRHCAEKNKWVYVGLCGLSGFSNHVWLAVTGACTASRLYFVDNH
jgi:hypothetical protein